MNSPSAPATRYRAARRAASSSRPSTGPIPLSHRSHRALMNSSPPTSARIAAILSARTSAEPAPSSILIPATPVSTARRTKAAAVPASSEKPPSTSALTGTDPAARTIRATAPSSSLSGGAASPSAPSGQPRAQAIPALVVATAFAPARTLTTAEAASQALGKISRPVWCRSRKAVIGGLLVGPRLPARCAQVSRLSDGDRGATDPGRNLNRRTPFYRLKAHSRKDISP